MKRREFSWAAASALAASTLALPAAHAQGKKPAEGTDYVALDKRVPVEAPQGKVEVIEFFWYSCPHCNAFEPKLEAWVKSIPKDVSFKRVPVAFRDDFVPQQRLFYALEALGKVDELQAKVFYAIHVERQPLTTQEPIANWVAKQGVDKAKFLELFNSFSVTTKARRATQLQDAYKVQGVPALGIAGRFYTDGSLAGNMERALQVTDFLIGEARKGA
ncbi:thiol:disulfide interchange protein DsbA/DsbL [Variovorax terrae]|uniref:Thiol:disulfide interchange protein n=1 Tax=Variovorax terrae TaxID=2923278 RepID=A0A9X2APQ6_9BURK|nr:thiol:disulfide interchange protein DsbA/DsbL [Variovorax terrae]MCJ0766038.1 thiol:disulfide interchange protein DsbA/DsbL [Variovorax terrae]